MYNKPPWVQVDGTPTKTLHHSKLRPASLLLLPIINLLSL